MDKRTVLALVIVALVIGAGPAILYYADWRAAEQNSSQNLTEPVPVNASMQGMYLNYRNGTPSKIYLVDSSATFGTFASDYRDPVMPSFVDSVHEASKGDRYINITGTIRNDFVSDMVYYIALEAQVYNARGEPIGTIVRTNGRPEFLASYMGLATNASGNFRILLKCDRKIELKDIKNYEIVLAWEPGPTPPP